ncbi:MAG TPA: phosphopantetheine-binding protein [Croceibacterium sp.]|nr:phosphopantetheine-binding protein [Croceibacterium sp.]
MTITQERLRSDIAAIIEVDPATIGDDDNLIDSGLDSMRVMNLVMQWDEQGVPLDFADIAEAPSVAGLWALLEQRQG